MKKKSKDVLVGGGLVAGVVALLVGCVFTFAYFEASTYNRLTDANVTTWDAVWVQLRVQAYPKREIERPIKRRFSVVNPG